MEEKIKELRAVIEEAAAAVTDQAQLSDFWQKFLSKNGAVAGLTKSLRVSGTKPCKAKLRGTTRVPRIKARHSLSAGNGAAPLRTTKQAAVHAHHSGANFSAGAWERLAAGDRSL